MCRLSRKKQPQRTVYVGSHEDKLSRVAPLRADPDERPTREDLETGGSPFDIPVPVPRILLPRRHRREKRDDPS
jgi:hypothetical protein